MDAIARDVLVFERFELDLGLACVRIGDQTIDLRPKTFAVLKLLAENAGRLVSKETLYRTVWPDIAVGDDSLSQCVHELRQLLGDGDRRLIRTVSRRGKVLKPQSGANTSAPPLREDTHGAGPRAIGGAVLLACVLGLAVVSASDVTQTIRSLADRWTADTDNLMSAADMSRIAALSATKDLPLPVYRIHAPAPDVTETDRRFLGVWVTDSGWINSNRQLMMIVTDVSKDGSVSGFFVNGPARPHSHIPGPAFSARFAGYISNGTLRYDGSAGMHLVTFAPDGGIVLRLTFEDGTVGVAQMYPAWTPDAKVLRAGSGSINAQLAP